MVVGEGCGNSVSSIIPLFQKGRERFGFLHCLDPKQLTIGLPQGSPLLVVLHILYSSSLLRQVEGSSFSMSMSLIDNVAFFTARNLHKAVKTSLQALANKALQWGNQHGAAFDRQKSQWMIPSQKKQPPPDTLSIHLGNIKPTSQPSMNWLAVIIDSELTFALHIKTQASRGPKAANKLPALAQTGWESL